MYFSPEETGRRIKKLREEMGFSQIEFAEKINVSRSYLSHVEIGDKSPSIDVLVEIYKFTGSSFEYLILGIAPEKQQAKAELKSMMEAALLFMEKNL